MRSITIRKISHVSQIVFERTVKNLTGSHGMGYVIISDTHISGKTSSRAMTSSRFSDVVFFVFSSATVCPLTTY